MKFAIADNVNTKLPILMRTSQASIRAGELSLEFKYPAGPRPGAVVCERFRGEYEITDIDGVRVKFDQGWGLVRASNTQPVLVLRFEATTQAKLDEYRTFVEGVVEEAKQELENSLGNRA